MQSGESLVFLISQPRAGSTLLQTVLGNHHSIFAPAEPWLMLHLAYMFNGSRRGLSAPYDSILYDDALQKFAERCLPHGVADLELAVRHAACELYSEALSRSGKSIFLDKTPRYYLIIEDLLRIFPRARFLFLIRNPLSVLNSIISTWRSGWAWDLGFYRNDLLSAPELLLNGIASAGQRGIVVKYEEFVASPASVLDKVLDHLELDYVHGMEVYGVKERRGLLGDQVGICLDTQPNRNSEEKWLQAASQDPVVWRLQWDYLHELGPDLIACFGYDFKRLVACLVQVRPPFARIAPSLAFSTSLVKGRRDRLVRRLRSRIARTSCLSMLRFRPGFQKRRSESSTT